MHVHPTDEFARRHLGCPWGKTEAWFVLEAAPGATVYLGLREAIPAAELAAMVEGQDVEGLLGALNPIGVVPGDSLVVPAGMPHAIGEGVFVAEVQQPTDFSIMLEWPPGLPGGELFAGLDLPTALQAVNASPSPPAALSALRRHVPAGLYSPEPIEVLAEAASPFFSLQLLRPEGEIQAGPGLAVWLVLEGEGWAREHDGEMELGKGDVFVLPHSCRPVVGGDVSLLSASGPRT